MAHMQTQFEKIIGLAFKFALLNYLPPGIKYIADGPIASRFGGVNGGLLQIRYLFLNSLWSNHESCSYPCHYCIVLAFLHRTCLFPAYTSF